jgi:endo-alpha-1,4-polygalactosaminidase (GH114 family)
MEFLSNATLAHNLSLGLKNAAAIIPTVLPLIHFSVNEQCAQYSECSSFTPIIAAKKPVFHIEYPDAGDEVTTAAVAKYCGKTADAEGFSTVVKNMNLDGWVEYCDYSKATTPLSTTSS